MKNSKILGCLFGALVLFSCNDNQEDNNYGGNLGSGNPNADSTLSVVVKTLDGANVVKGLAADGASAVQLLVKFDGTTNPANIIVSATGEEFGFLSNDTVLDAEEGSSISIVPTTAELEAGELSLYLFSEERLPEGLVSDSVATVNYCVKAGSSIKNFSVEVVRPAAIFAHGFASSAVTFDPMFGFIRPMGLYVESGLYALDYMMTSLSHYVVNKNVVPDAIDYTRAAMLEQGYVCQKFALIGHSMGGALIRLYVQSTQRGVEYRDDILKIITIDTPHSGTQLADFGMALSEQYPDSPLAIVGKIGAIVDFQTSSDATVKDLNGETLNNVILPTHVLSGTFGDTMSLLGMISDGDYVEAILVFLLQDVLTSNIYGEDNDLIVPLSSQIGGVEDGIGKKYVQTYSGEWHCTVHTTQEAADDIVELLDTPSTDTKVFSMDGFNPEQLSYDANTHQSVQMTEKELGDIKEMGIDKFMVIYSDEDSNILDMSYSDNGEIIESDATDAPYSSYVLGVDPDNSENLYYSNLRD